MPLQPGTWLAHYEILGHIGSGGMGDVYHARDNKLQREVALKVLPEHFSRDPERIARFRREAQLLAQLNHPNIAILYNFEETGETRFLVMELVLGETLRERIKRGPLPLEESLEICSQITEALEHAHEKPIIHRDLKPANVKVTPQGQVKVLDFGLAKAFGGDRSAIDPHDLPTGSLAGTLKGTILGTPAYMPPEQASGRTVDKRADIWALGCVLYELLTGKQAFTGDTVTEIIASVLKSEPDWSALPADTGPNVRVLLRRCLRKDLPGRFRDATDVRIQIEETQAAPATTTEPGAATLRPAKIGRRAMLWGVAGLCAGFLIATLAVWNLKPETPRTTARLGITLPEGERLGGLDLPAMAFSPDGRQLAYVAGRGGSQQLYLRAVDSQEAKALSGTEGASGPFFSPDGQWLGFFADSKLKKVSVTGGAPVTLAPTGPPRGASWGTNDLIVFSLNTTSGLFQVPAAGGKPEPFTTLDTKKGEGSHRFPQFLPGGKALLFTVGTGGSWDEAQIVAQRLDTGERKVLIQGGSDGRYVPTGHLVYVRAATLMAVPFSPERLEVTGTPVPVIEGVMQGADNTGAAHAGISSQGWLAYIPGGNLVERRLVWVDRKGKEQPLTAPPRPYQTPKLSPDGQRVAVGIDQGNKSDIWIYDISRNTLSRLTFEATNLSPIWTPDGKKVTFQSNKMGPVNLFWKPADGSGPEERLTSNQNSNSPGSWSPDGQRLAFVETHPDTGLDIWVLPLQGERKPIPVVRTPFSEKTPMFSPDGRWLAYESNDSGRYEVYVQPFPGPGGKLQISTDGGAEAIWARNGELFYRNGDKMMAVAIATQPTFRAGQPRLLFEGPYRRQGNQTYYDVTPDGQRFLMVKDSAQATTITQINVVLNWFEELKRRVPAGTNR